MGAAWYRTYTEANHGHGFVAEDVPELAIAVIASRRHEGIGRRLLIDLIDASVAQGYAAMSLSVPEANPARGLYESTGFVPIEKHGTPGRWSDTRVSQTERLPPGSSVPHRRAAAPPQAYAPKHVSTCAAGVAAGLIAAPKEHISPSDRRVRRIRRYATVAGWVTRLRGHSPF